MLRQLLVVLQVMLGLVFLRGTPVVLRDGANLAVSSSQQSRN